MLSSILSTRKLRQQQLQDAIESEYLQSRKKAMKQQKNGSLALSKEA